jgi:Inner membrane component of T3SS, cytoplasmic domain
MSMKRCDSGHFYDSTKHSSCPWCGVRVEADVDKTRPIRPSQETPRNPSEDEGVTRALHREPSGISPVVGWLVCIDGPDKGRDYRLHGEKNFIGRSTTMDICISGDESISREKHAAVSFEPKKRIFWLLPGEASGLVYVNEEVVNTPTQLKSRDIVELGKTKMMFYPFCDEQFQWD